MNTPAAPGPDLSSAQSCVSSTGTAFGCPRDFLDNRFVYTVISPRARGLSVGVNVNPDKFCNFDCVYCEVNRHEPSRESRLDVGVMAKELEQTLEMAQSGRIRERECYRTLPAEMVRWTCQSKENPNLSNPSSPLGLPD